MAIDESHRSTKLEQESSLRIAGKYFLHGLLYSLLMNAFAVVWAFLLFLLAVLGSIIGIIVGFALFFIGMGLVNKAIAGWIWGIRARGAWTSLLGHGLYLFLVLFVVHLPWMFADLILAYASTEIGIVYEAFQFLVMAIVYGLVGKRVASSFEETGHVITTLPPTQQRFASATKGPSFCPACGAPFPYRDTDIGPDGMAVCRHCGAALHDSRYKRGDSSDTGAIPPRP